MTTKKITSIIYCLLLIIQFAKANQNNDSIVLQNYQSAYNEITTILENENALNFEDAIFSMENAYYNNQLSKKEFTNTLDFHTSRIIELAYANKDRVPNSAQFENSVLPISPSCKAREDGLVLLNWAIYTYITDTTYWKQNGEYVPHYPLTYQNTDPFGKENWETTQITSLLKTNKGNCFSLSTLYYIFSQRLHSQAYLTTAPGHIYIQHKGFDGNFYNVELTTHTFPGSGTIKTYTYTSHAAVESGIAMHRLNEKESIALCFVYLAKGYEKKLKIMNGELRMEGEESRLCENFTLQCTNKALEYDSLCLSAMLLKQQILEKMVLKEEQGDAKTNKELETSQLALANYGYIQMPQSMQQALVDNIQGISEIKTVRAVSPFNLFDNRYTYTSLSKNKFPEIINFQANNQGIPPFSLGEKGAGDEGLDLSTFALSIDPLAQKFPSVSPYNSVANNPMNRIDPTGMADEAAGNFDPLPNASAISVSDEIVNKMVASRDAGEYVFLLAQASLQSNKKLMISRLTLTRALDAHPQSGFSTQINKAMPLSEINKIMNLKVEGNSLTLNTVTSDQLVNIPLKDKDNNVVAQLTLTDGASIDFSHLSYQYDPNGACDNYSALRNSNGTIYMKGVSISTTLFGQNISIPIKKLNVVTTVDEQGNNITKLVLPPALNMLAELLSSPSHQNKYQCSTK